MNRFQQLLDSEPYLLLDGAMGTTLMASGLLDGGAPEAWNLSQPEKIRDIHRRYIEAGSRLILTNTFGGSRFRLKLHGLEDRAQELNRAAAVNARVAADEAPHLVAVAGSMGPTGELLAPMGTMTFEQARDAFAEQAAGLVEGDVDVLWVETMSDLNEAQAAIEGARLAGDLPVVASMSFDTHGRTMMGVSPEQALEILSGFDLLALGANCGSSLPETLAAVEAMHLADPDVNLVAKPNAGIPRWEGDQLVYDGTPEVMADYALRMRTAGARLIGACCGSTPDHIRAMAEALEDPHRLPSMATSEELVPQAVVSQPDSPPAGRRRRRRRSRR